MIGHLDVPLGIVRLAMLFFLWEIEAIA